MRGFYPDKDGEGKKEAFLHSLKIPEVSELLNKSVEVSRSDLDKLNYFLEEVMYAPILRDKLKEALEKIKGKGNYKKIDQFKGMKVPNVPKVDSYTQSNLSPIAKKLKELAKSGDLQGLENFGDASTGYAYINKFINRYRKELIALVKKRIENTGSNVGFQALADLNVAFDNASIAIPSLSIIDPKKFLEVAGFYKDSPIILSKRHIKLPSVPENKALGLKKGQFVYLRRKATGELFGITEITEVERDVEKGTVTATLGKMNVLDSDDPYLNEGLTLKHTPKDISYYMAGYKDEDIVLGALAFGELNPIQKQMKRLGIIDRENNMPPGTSINDAGFTDSRKYRIDAQIHKFDRPAPMITAITKRFVGANGDKDKMEELINYAGRVNYGSKGAFTKISPLFINALYGKALNNIMDSVQRGEKLKQGSVQERVEAEAKKIIDSYSADADGLYQMAKDMDSFNPLRFHPLRMSFGAKIMKNAAGKDVIAIPIVPNVYGKMSVNVLSEFAQGGGKNLGTSPNGLNFFVDPDNAADIASIRNILLKAGVHDAMLKK